MDAYRDQYATLLHNGEKVLMVGISVDPAAELTSWAQDRKYPFRLLSDPMGAVGKAFGAYERKYSLDNRTLYVVAPGGKIAYVANPFQEIDPTAYADLAAAIDQVRQ